MARVLLVDDDDQVLRGLMRALEHMGHQVTAAADGSAALRALAELPHDLVVTDINMPGMDGIELIMAVSGQWPEMPVIAMSGGGRLPKELLLDTASVLGAVVTLAKPVDLHDLGDAVRRALGTDPAGPSPAEG